MNLHQALNVALDYEHRVRDHYAKGSKQIEDLQGRKVFETLAREEQGHVDYLKHCLEQWTKEGKVDPSEIKPVVAPGVEWIDKAKAELQKRPGKRVASGTEIDLLKVALELEITTSSFYRDLVSKLPDADKLLFSKFLEIEEGHVSIVQAELDAVQGMGFWFDIMEFNLEAG